MAIWHNPVARREWVWAKRHWPAGLAVFLVALALSAALLFLVPTMMARMGGSLIMWGWTIGMMGFRVPLLIAVYLVALTIDRERRENGWEQLASTRLSTREILWGKLAVPIALVWALNIVVFAFHFAYMVYFFRKLSSSTTVSWGLLAITYPIGLVEDLLYTLMASLVTFHLCWRRSFGHGLLVSYGVLLAIGLGAGIVSEILSGLSNILLSVFGVLSDIGWRYSVQNLARNGPACAIEFGVIIWASRRVLAAMRSDLAAGAESRLG